MTFTGFNKLTAIKWPTGLTTTNLYDAGNFLWRTADLEIGRSNTFSYTTNGLIAVFTNELGLVVSATWDDLLRLTSAAFPDGTYTSNRYDKLDLAASRNRLGQWSYFGYNGLRQLTAFTNANNVVTRLGWCGCGSLETVTNAWNTPAQMVMSFAYDLQGNRTNVFLPDATVTNWHDALGRITMTADGQGYRLFLYNNQGLVTNISNALGTEQSVVYDIQDRPFYVTDGNGVSVTNTYDLLDRLLTRTYPGGGVERFGYSARGLTAYTNQLGQTNFYAYDQAGRTTFVTNANNELIRFTNNAASELLSLTDGKGQTTRWNYDEYGRVTNKLDQSGTEILRYKYDPDSRLTNRWSVAKGDTKYKYDPVGNLTNIDYATSVDVSFAYDALNRVTSMVDAVGTTTFGYTAGGELWTEDGPFSSDTLTNGYLNRFRTSLSLAQPTGSWTNAFGYDAARRLTNVTSQAGAFNYTYNWASPLPLKLSLPNTSYITNIYDGLARLTGTYLKNSSHTTLDSSSYIYNPANQRTNLTRTDASTYDFSYDPIGELKVANGSVNAEDRGYAYDTAWNLNYRTNNGALKTFSVEGKNQLTSAGGTACFYDANGNLLHVGEEGIEGTVDYGYDDENRLIAVSTNYNILETPVSGLWQTYFTYDGLGRLRKRLEYVDEVLQTTTVYIYDGLRVVQERNGSNTPLVSYTRGNDLSGSLEGAGGIGGLLGRSHGYSSGNWSTHNFYHADGGGNITYLVDSSQALAASYRYDPFGNVISSSGTLAGANVYRFSSKETHVKSGMYYYGARFYEPNLQRWPNRDPIGEWGGINLYGFVGNSPLNAVDPNGMFFKEFFSWVGRGLYDLMMGERSEEDANKRNWDTYGAQRAKLLDGIDRNDNVLRESIGEGVALAGDWTTDAVAAEAGGRLAAGALGAGAKACKNLKPGANAGEQVADATAALAKKKKPPRFGKEKEIESFLDATGRVHGDLPNPRELGRYHPEDLRQLLESLKQSVPRRTESTARLGATPGHDARIAEEQQLIKAIEKFLTGS